MAHHQGMSLLSIANFLANGIVQEWFHAHPRVQATELLCTKSRSITCRPMPPEKHVFTKSAAVQLAWS